MRQLFFEKVDLGAEPLAHGKCRVTMIFGK